MAIYGACSGEFPWCGVTVQYYSTVVAGRPSAPLTIVSLPACRLAVAGGEVGLSVT